MTSSAPDKQDPTKDRPMPAEAESDDRKKPDMAKVLTGIGGGGAIMVAAWGYFNDQFTQIRDEQTSMRTLVVDMRKAQSERSREIEFRVERNEERLRVMPEGVGVDRWTGKAMEIWSLRLGRDNPTIAIPRIDDLKTPR